MEDSLRKYGAGRSILLDREGRIIAGNKTAERAADIGLDEVIVVRTKGHQIVAVQRDDLDLHHDPEARALSIADNRVGEVDLAWDSEVLEALKDDGVDLEPLWSENEWNLLMGNIQVPDDPNAEWQAQGMPDLDGQVRAERALTVYFQSEKDCEEFAALIGAEINGKTKYVWYPREPD